MKRAYLLVAAAPLALATPTMAQEVANSAPQANAEAKAAEDNRDVVTTGVARGRDRLDMAISTSSLSREEITKLAPTSVGELLRALPGIRSEASYGEGGASISIRGLPIASSGTKFVQLQEDGLPVMEFGDFVPFAADSFVRADLNLAQVESLRGGSSSTFASNSPGGVINFQSRTGDVAGGAIQTTIGLDYETYRTDFAYGAPISDGLRFHVGGFYRQGEGPRKTGFDAYEGGQLKLNVTKDFAGGYIRFHGKFLDDSTPFYSTTPLRVSGTDSDPVYSNIGDFDAVKDTLLSRYIPNTFVMNGQNELVRHSLHNGQQVKEKSVGLETQFDLSGWSVSERMRFSDKSARVITPLAPVFGTLEELGDSNGSFGGPGATFTYVNGPNQGQAIDPTTLAQWLTIHDTDLRSVDSFVNDFRVSRVWNIGGGDLTTTAGLYTSRQELISDWLYAAVISELRGNGEAALIDITRADGTPVTQGGFQAYNFSLTNGMVRRSYDVDYAIDAPFASLNYSIGGLALGASARYDFGNVSGQIMGQNGMVDPSSVTTSYDVNHDGVISLPETKVGFMPITSPAPVDYNYGYLSYSVSANYRIAEPVAVFARYSRGGRANADRILFTELVSYADGSLADKSAAVDFVKQAEVGVKYRANNLTLNLTGFWAETEETNLGIDGNPISREFAAKGLEFEGAYQMGPFSLTAGATYTDAEIKNDGLAPEKNGNTPPHQPELLFQLTPQYSTDLFSVGAVFIGTTESYASDFNTLVMPGYVTTNAFVQFRPTDRLLLSVNANNLFNKRALVAVEDQFGGFTPDIKNVRTLNGRAISATARFSF